MYLESLHVKNLKRVHDVELAFTRKAAGPRMWTVIIGENGSAKTSLLQAIALAAANPGLLAALTHPRGLNAHLRDKRAGSGPLSIKAAFALHEDWALDAPNRRVTHHVFHDLTSPQNPQLVGRTLGDDPHTPLRLPGFLVIGYGVGRIVGGPRVLAPLTQPALDRLLPLFDPGAPILGLDFADVLDRDLVRSFCKHVQELVVGTGRKLLPGIDALELRGRGGVRKASDLIERNRFTMGALGGEAKLPMLALSHGYQSVIALVADILGHAYLDHEKAVHPKDIKGIVLVDEIDAFFHPTWQANVIPLLRKKFPQVQFIVTTHSPVVLAGAEPDEVVSLTVDDDGSVEAQQGRGPQRSTRHLPDPRVLSPTELYRAFFGLDDVPLHPHGKNLRRYTMLATDPFRSTVEDKEATQLEAVFKKAGLASPSDRVARKHAKP